MCGNSALFATNPYMRRKPEAVGNHHNHTREHHMAMGKIQTEGGLYKGAMARMKTADKSGNRISAAEIEKEGDRMIAHLKAQYSGLKSSAGLAADRNVLGKTARAITKNMHPGAWSGTPKAKAALAAYFGPGLDGLNGLVAAAVKEIRSDVAANRKRTSSVYG